MFSTGLHWHLAGRASHYCRVEVGVQVPSLLGLCELLWLRGTGVPLYCSPQSFHWQHGWEALLPLDGGESLDSLLGRLWRHSSGREEGSAFLPGANGSPGFPCGPCWHQEVGEPSSAWKRRRSQLLTWSPLITPFWRAFSALWLPGECANMGFPDFPLLMKMLVVAAVFLWSLPGDKWPLLEFCLSRMSLLWSFG